MQATSVSRRRRIWLLVGGLIVAGLVVIGGIGWAAWYVIDNIDAPGPGATGSGPCGPGDSVNLQLAFADGHVVQACTRDRPACPNGSQFSIGNQLRSSSRRYILFVRFDAGLPAEAAAQTITLEPGPGFMPGEQASAALTRAIVQITPRDPTEAGYTTRSGSLTVSSTHGVARGRIDGSFSSGPTRPDRPAPSSNAVSPMTIAGSFACNR